MSNVHSVSKSFGYALSGIRTALKKEPNFIIHLCIGILTMFAAAFLKFSIGEWLILLLIISFVLALELVNTAIEAVVDLVSPEIKDEAKIAKDTAAAAVFLSVITAIIVGLVLFVPRFIFIR